MCQLSGILAAIKILVSKQPGNHTNMSEVLSVPWPLKHSRTLREKQKNKRERANCPGNRLPSKFWPLQSLATIQTT